MPLYEYRCTACSHVFELHHEVGGSPGVCPNCGGTPRRIFTSVGLIFKGSGFYTTDNRHAPASDPKTSSEDGGKNGTTAKENSGTSTGTSTGPSTGPSTGTSTEAASKGT